MAWLLERAPGVNSAPRDPVPSGSCHELLLKPGPLGLPKTFWEKGAAMLSLATEEEEKAEDSGPGCSFAKKLEISRWESRRWVPP